MYTMMLVDDETIIREGLRDCIDWDALGISIIAEADNGVEALAKAESCSPDIILTDVIMPGLDGITFIKALRQRNTGLKIIMISAHPNIDYIKAAFKLDVTDYILKPFNLEELHQVISKVTSQLTEERKQIAMLRQRLVEQVLSGKGGLDEAALRQWPIPLNSAYYVVMQIEAEGDSSKSLPAIEAALQETAAAFVFRQGPERYTALVAIPGKNPGSWLKVVGERLIRSLIEQLGGPVTIGAGLAASNLRQLPLSYEQAALALNRRVLSGKGRLYCYTNEDREQQRHIPLDLFKAQDHIIALLNDGEAGDPEQAIRRLFTRIRAEKLNNLLYIQTLCSDLLVGAIRRLSLSVEREAVDEAARSLAELGRLQDSYELERFIIAQFNHFAHLLSEGKEGRFRKQIRQVMDIVRERYREELSIPELAERVALSPSHMAYLFKKELHMTVNDYITHIRMQKAKQLLGDPMYKIYEIALMVGYKDANYFTRLFRKTVGMAPLEFREAQL